MRAALYLFVAGLVGCAWTPDELRRDGIHVQTSARPTPDVLARCLQRRVEAQSGQINTRLTPTGANSFEVLARIEPSLFPSTFEGAQMLFEIRPNPNAWGSLVDAWFTRWTDNPTEDGLRGLMSGC